MSDHHAYPSELASFVRSVWPGQAAPLPRDLETLLSLAYQATLLREEERPITLRMVVASPEAFPASSGPPHGVMRLLFAEPRPLTDARELSRLAPAAKYARAMIGVSESEPEGRLAIWGILYTGPRWLERRQGGRSLPPEIPSSPLVIRAFGPGLIAVAHGDHTVAELRGGVMARPGVDVFESTWLPARFAPIRAELAALHAQAEQAARGRDGEPAWGPLAPDLTRALSYGMVRRVIATMRNAHHGGALVILPPDCTATRYLHLKYTFAEEEPRRRHRTLVLAAMRALARQAGAESLGRPAGWRDYASETRDPFPAIDEAFFEMSHLIAGLTDVDGAVVVNQRWEVLGFGAEIVGELPEVTRVAVAGDRDATSRTWEATDGVGTRHRSAYRLCAAVHEAIAIVVSQDGSVRWVAWHDDAVTCWNHVPADPVDEPGA
jgi:hypothetical protein